MQWTIAAKDPIQENHDGVGLDVDYCLTGSVDVEAKGTNVETALHVHFAQDPGGNSGPADVFDCVNTPQYGCPEKVNRAGGKCSECIHLKRMPGGRPALHSVSSHDQYGTETLKHDPEPADRYDCVNKPLYQCEEKVSRPNTKCSICVLRSRGTGGQVALHPTSASDQYDTRLPESDDDSDPDNLSLLDDDE